MGKILISACLLGEKVRYDQKHNLIDHPQIAHWQTEGRLVPVCPEVLGGLPTPRPPAEIKKQHPLLIETVNQHDVTPAFLAGAERALEIAQQHNVCCALMKAKSPSCGNEEIYDGSFQRQLIAGQGAAASELVRNGIPVFNEQQLDKLFDFLEGQPLYGTSNR